jgi:hypothetical protein
MDRLDDLLRSLLHEGRISFRERPTPASGLNAAVGVLREAYLTHASEVAGPPIAFDEEVALAAALLVIEACWALVHPTEPVPAFRVGPGGGNGPVTASEHLSADLTFQYLPQIHQRARAIDRSDPLRDALEAVLRAWPLSGVLADLEDAPAAPVDLEGHEGLMLLYAERWARHGIEAWRPRGRAGEYAELVLGDPLRARTGLGSLGARRHE